MWRHRCRPTLAQATNRCWLIINGVTFIWEQFRKNAQDINLYNEFENNSYNNYSDVIMNVMASQITGVSIVCSTVCSVAEQRYQSFASLSPLWGNAPVTSGFPSQRASYAENASIWERHHMSHFSWDKELNHVINRRTTYFVVCQNQTGLFCTLYRYDRMSLSHISNK